MCQGVRCRYWTLERKFVNIECKFGPGWSCGGPGRGPPEHGLSVVPEEVAKVAGILCGSGRGVLARGGGGPTGRVGCVLVVRDGRVSWRGVGGPHPSAADVGRRSPRNARSLKQHTWTRARVMKRAC